MLRQEIMSETGLSRKALEYYEEQGCIQPIRRENGYRDYSFKDLAVLKQIKAYRILGLSLYQIQKILASKSGTPLQGQILRDLDIKVEQDTRKKSILKQILLGAKIEDYAEDLILLEGEETIYEKLCQIFPGYLGQLLFINYQPFFNEPVNDQEALTLYIQFLDQLPAFELDEKEKRFLEESSQEVTYDQLQKINQDKLKAVKDFQKWQEENEDWIEKYMSYKESPEYLNHPMAQISNKMKQYFEENQYYDKAIPLIRKFSASYDKYYQSLIQADQLFLKKYK